MYSWSILPSSLPSLLPSFLPAAFSSSLSIHRGNTTTAPSVRGPSARPSVGLLDPGCAKCASAAEATDEFSEAHNNRSVFSILIPEACPLMTLLNGTIYKCEPRPFALGYIGSKNNFVLPNFPPHSLLPLRGPSSLSLVASAVRTPTGRWPSPPAAMSRPMGAESGAGVGGGGGEERGREGQASSLMEGREGGRPNELG